MGNAGKCGAAPLSATCWSRLLPAGRARDQHSHSPLSPRSGCMRLSTCLTSCTSWEPDDLTQIWAKQDDLISASQDSGSDPATQLQLTGFSTLVRNPSASTDLSSEKGNQTYFLGPSGHQVKQGQSNGRGLSSRPFKVWKKELKRADSNVPGSSNSFSLVTLASLFLLLCQKARLPLFVT